MPNPGKYFQKPGGHSEGFLENFSRLFSKFLISGHEWGAFLENFSSWISWLPTKEKMILEIGSWLRGVSGKFFQTNFIYTYSGKNTLKKIVWKNFPEILLSHHPKIVNFNFYFKSCILEKFSKNSPVSRPKILKMAFGNIFQKTSWFTTRIFRCDQFWTQIFEKGYLRGLLWYHV